MKSLINYICYFLFGLCMVACGLNLPEGIEAEYAQLPKQIDFNFHVRPILSDRCFACHGPDANKREADLRLDIEEEAKKALVENPGKYAIVSGSPGNSQLFHRILSEDSGELMPPPESNLNLTAREKAILIKWIQQGAEWKDHWAFITPEKTKLPRPGKHKYWVKSPIDAFVFKKLEENELEPSEGADKERLLRRLSLDLTGLPPTIAEIDAFVSDNSQNAYEEVVDRLLSSEAHAERMAMEWMDVARYADSHGMHADGWRMMWPWRDWVIDAFQQNMPYDQFVSWQLAGDLYPEAQKPQILATAFNRNHPMTAEGGAIDEEYRLSYVWDRAETFGTAFLGLTLNCARCHDHKFDPISQKEYYQLTAFFNNQHELGMTGNDGNFGPLLALADSVSEKRLDSIKGLIKKKEDELENLRNKLLLEIDNKTSRRDSAPLSGGRSKSGEFLVKNSPDLEWGLIDHYPFNSTQNHGKKGYSLDKNQFSKSGVQPKLRKGKKSNAIEFNGDYDHVQISNNINFEWPEPFSAAIWINTTKLKKGLTQAIMGTAGAKNNFGRGWELYLDDDNRLNLKITSAYPANYIHLQSKDSILLNSWTHVAFSYDGSGKAKGATLYMNGQRTPSSIQFDRLYKSIKTTAGRANTPVDRPIRLGLNYRGNTGDNGVFKGLMDEMYLWKKAIGEYELFGILGPISQNEAPENDWYKTHLVQRNSEIQSLEAEVKSMRFEYLALMDPIAEIMVMEEMQEPRKTFAYERGEYDAPMYEVNHAVPEILPGYDENLPKNRLGLANWLFDTQNPLTARVTVNRYWQMIFGRGLVNTPEDFGVQGALPSHPELLDWLAVDFMENDWDLRHLLKQMVMSHSYRQASATKKIHLEKDPENILLARAPSYRLQAEMIRDVALSASGLLVQKLGGPSVKPYQPDGLWIEKGNFSHKLLRYKQQSGDSLYRRSMYTFIKRTSPPPAMAIFDTPNRTACVVKRENTNTPLQPLVLLNDPQFVEAARVLAERMQIEGGLELGSQINYAFRLATGQEATSAELGLLEELFHEQRKRFQADESSVKELLAMGEAPLHKMLDPTMTAALTMVSSTILNHDGMYMKR